MKKLLILSTVVTIGTVSAMAQGKVNLNDGGSVGVFLTIESPTINGGTPVTVGNTAGAFPGAGPGQVTVDIYAAPSGTSLQALLATTPIFSGLNSASGLAQAQGTFNAGTSVLLGTGGIAVSGWNGSSPLEFIATASNTGGTYFGTSTEATGVQPATGLATPVPIFGTTPGLISSFVMSPAGIVPEPTTLALGGLGAAALLFFRRRK